MTASTTKDNANIHRPVNMNTNNGINCHQTLYRVFLFLLHNFRIKCRHVRKQANGKQAALINVNHIVYIIEQGKQRQWVINMFICCKLHPLHWQLHSDLKIKIGCNIAEITLNGIWEQARHPYLSSHSKCENQLFSMHK